MVVGFDMAQSAQNIIDQFFDKVFVINLDKRPDKWRRMEVELERLKIKSVERFAAIQPSFETISELDYSNMKAPEGAGPYPDYVAGSVGCKRSHLEIIRRAKAEGLKRILILEDDVSFKWRALSKLQKAVAELPSDWHMLYFGGYHLQRPVKFGRRLRRLRTTYSTFAYGFNLELSDYILESAEQSGKEIDVFYAEHVQPNYNCYIVQKGIAYQRAGFSDILGTQVNYRWLRG